MAADLPPMPAGASRTRRHEVANALNTTAVRALRAARVGDTGTGLTPERLSLLSVLAFGGPTTMSALAREEQVSPPAITRIVGALEAQGLVRRATAPRDRRQSVVSVTRTGRRLLERGRRARIDRLAAVLEALEPDELRGVDEALELVRRALRIAART